MVSGINSSMQMASGALSTLSVGTQVTAHNIANVSTGDFLPQRATYATGPGGAGVELESVRKQPAAVISEEAGGIPVGKRASGTELAREFPQLMTTQRAFEANAATIRAADEMFGSLLNIIA